MGDALGVSVGALDGVAVGCALGACVVVVADVDTGLAVEVDGSAAVGSGVDEIDGDNVKLSIVDVTVVEFDVAKSRIGVKVVVVVVTDDGSHVADGTVGVGSHEVDSGVG